MISIQLDKDKILGGRARNHVSMQGPLETIAFEAGLAVISMYQSMARDDPEAAATFRAIMADITAADSEAWDQPVAGITIIGMGGHEHGQA